MFIHFRYEFCLYVRVVKAFEEPQWSHWDNIAHNADKQELIGNSAFNSDYISMNFRYIGELDAGVAERTARVQISGMRQELVTKCNESFSCGAFQPLCELVKDSLSNEVTALPVCRLYA